MRARTGRDGLGDGGGEIRLRQLEKSGAGRAARAPGNLLGKTGNFSIRFRHRRAVGEDNDRSGRFRHIKATARATSRSRRASRLRSNAESSKTGFAPSVGRASSSSTQDRHPP